MKIKNIRKKIFVKLKIFSLIKHIKTNKVKTLYNFYLFKYKLYIYLNRFKFKN